MHSLLFLMAFATFLAVVLGALVILVGLHLLKQSYLNASTLNYQKKYKKNIHMAMQPLKPL